MLFPVKLYLRLILLITDHFIINCNELIRCVSFENKDSGHFHLNTSVRKRDGATKMMSHA